MDNILSQRCLLTERTEKTRAMKEREAWEKDLPACRRLLFPLLPACNKGNRRRLHAGNRSIRNFILSPGSFPGKPRRLTMVCARPGEWGICTGSTGRICSEKFALKSSYFSHDSSHSENVASARRVLFTSSS